MVFRYDFIEVSKLQERFKETILADMHFIEDNLPDNLISVYLFGSTSRGEMKPRSDVDICLVFKDGTNFRDYNLMVFRGFLTGLETPVRTDVVMLVESNWNLTLNYCIVRLIVIR